MKAKGLIIALDVTDKEKALNIAEETSSYVQAIKVGYPLVLSSGLDIIEELMSYTETVIADFKVADIPNTSKIICRLARNAGAACVIVHGFVGEDVLKACSEIVDIIVVAEMSHPGAEAFIQPVSEEIALLACEYARGIVAPATRPERITKLRYVVGRKLLIISPGVKAQGAEIGDAMRAGADFEIVGREIYESERPGEKARKIAKILKKV
ncbi:orotidine 5'-phosphate decarboxylase [archaeon]|nr:orotidine 5'-phosphate decarboxylase [archaeon]